MCFLFLCSHTYTHNTYVFICKIIYILLKYFIFVENRATYTRVQCKWLRKRLLFSEHIPSVIKYYFCIWTELSSISFPLVVYCSTKKAAHSCTNLHKINIKIKRNCMQKDVNSEHRVQCTRNFLQDGIILKMVAHRPTQAIVYAYALHTLKMWYISF